MGRVPLIYLESPANPTNALVDVQAVRRGARRRCSRTDERPPIAIDNTFLGPLWQHPLRHGADLVGLFADQICRRPLATWSPAAITGSKELINPIRMMRNTIGTITDPNTAWMLLRSLETLELRMTRAGENAAKVCAFLRDHPKVESVGYLGFLERRRRPPGRHLPPPLHRRRLDLLALSEGRREGGLRLPRRAQDRPSRGQPRRHRDAGQRAGGDDPSVGPARAQAGARHHRQSGADLDRRRGCRTI